MRKLFKKLPKNYWKKGGGEILGFMMIVPCMFLIICAIVAAAQIAYTNQSLTYCAYNACRSAVVSDDLSIARERAQNSYDLQMGTSNARKYGYTSCELQIMDGSYNASWQKGVFVKCTVRYYVKTLMPFTSGLREQTIVMMIENGAG